MTATIGGAKPREADDGGPIHTPHLQVSVSVSVSMCLCYSDDVQLYLADHFDDSYLLLVRIFAVLMTTLYICNVCTQGAYVVYVNTVYTHSKL